MSERNTRVSVETVHYAFRSVIPEKSTEYTPSFSFGQRFWANDRQGVPQLVESRGGLKYWDSDSSHREESVVVEILDESTILKLPSGSE